MQEFGDAVELTPGSTSFAKIRAIHAEVGDIAIREDGSELILFIGNITHGHFGSYENDLSEEQHEQIIAESLVDFLLELLADKYFLFKSVNTGGWARFDMIEEGDMQSPNTQWFKWSGPIRKMEQR